MFVLNLRPSAGDAQPRPRLALPGGAHRAIRWLAELPFPLCAAILVLVFLVTRLPFFIHYPVVSLWPDTASYVTPILQAQAGSWPSFAIRSPGYPLFIWAVTSVRDRWWAVILVQNLLSLAGSLFLVYSVRRTRPGLALAATLALVGFLGSSQVLTYDTFALSDSLYASCLLFSMAFLLLALHQIGALWDVLASLAMAGTILVKPAGMYLAVIYVLVVAFMLWNRYVRSGLLAFVIPLPIVLLALCVYNALTVHVFALSAFGEINLAGATIALWQPDPGYPPQVNAVLAGLPGSLANAGFTAQDRQILDASWNADLLYPIFRRAYAVAVNEGWGSGRRFSDKTYVQTNSLALYVESSALIRRIELTSIQRSPALYAKFVWANMVYYFKMPSPQNFYVSLARSARKRAQELTHAGLYHQEIAKENATAPLPAAVQVTGTGMHTRVSLKETRLQSLHLLWQSAYAYVYQRQFWVWVYFAVLAGCSYVLAVSRGRHLGAFVLFVLTASVLGGSLVVCLVEMALQRYSYPTQFVYYLAPALLPLLWSRSAATMKTSGG